MIIYDIKRIIDAMRFIKENERWEIKNGLYVLSVENEEYKGAIFVIRHLGANKIISQAYSCELFSDDHWLEYALDRLIRELAEDVHPPPHPPHPTRTLRTL